METKKKKLGALNKDKKATENQDRVWKQIIDNVSQ